MVLLELRQGHAHGAIQVLGAAGGQHAAFQEVLEAGGQLGSGGLAGGQQGDDAVAVEGAAGEDLLEFPDLFQGDGALVLCAKVIQDVFRGMADLLGVLGFGEAGERQLSVEGVGDGVLVAVDVQQPLDGRLQALGGDGAQLGGVDV